MDVSHNVDSNVEPGKVRGSSITQVTVQSLPYNEIKVYCGQMLCNYIYATKRKQIKSTRILQYSYFAGFLQFENEG